MALPRRPIDPVVSAEALSRWTQSKIEFDTNGGYWLWTGMLDAKGYGRVGHCRTHRVAYTARFGPIPDHLVVDHQCRVRSCINPAHLRAVTVKVNTLENSKSNSAVNAAKTHCQLGHPFDAENTSHSARGERRCRTCSRLSYRKRHGLPMDPASRRLSPQQVNAIRNSTESAAKLAALFGIHRATVRRIITREAWGGIT